MIDGAPKGVDRWERRRPSLSLFILVDDLAIDFASMSHTKSSRFSTLSLLS